MKKTLLFGCALALFAGCAQVSSSEYIRDHGQYGRTDGLSQRKDSEGFDLMINGAAQGSIGKAVYEDFTDYGDGDDWCMQSDYSGCSGTAGEVNQITFPSGNKLACQIMGTQTIEGAVDMDAGSLDIAGDQTDNDGVECAWGVHGASGGAFTVGTDGAFFTCVQMMIEETDGTDEFHFGFRRANDDDSDTGGFNQTFDNYHDLAAFSIITAANPAALQTSTIAADGGTSETDTTDTIADETRFDLCVFVSAAGVTTFYHDLSSAAASSFSDIRTPTASGTYTFTDGESVVPFMHMLQANADQTGEVDLYEWVAGYGTFPLTASE